MYLQFFFVAALCASSTAFLDLFDFTSDWHMLHVKLNDGQVTNSFEEIPIYRPRVAGDGFTKISDCDASPNAKFRGERYANSDKSVVMLYGKNGNIVGMQTGIPKDKSDGQQLGLVEDGDYYYLTIYFVKPGDWICTKGRKFISFIADDGLGQSIWVQTGPNLDGDVTQIRRITGNLDSTQWKYTKCHSGLGKHISHTVNEKCDDIFPVFVMENRFAMTGFGFMIKGNLTSDYYEHLEKADYSAYFPSPPACLDSAGPYSIIRVEFSDKIEHDC